jgi:ribonuclease P protein component
LTGSNQQFGRASRLTKADEFRRVFSRSKISQDRHFRVLCRPNNLERARLGLAVSKKVCARATGRNRLKRLIRESFRNHQESLAAQGGIDIVVLPKQGAASMCNTTLRNALDKHWARCATFATGMGGESSEGRT